MTSNDKKIKSDTAPKSDAPPKDKGAQETAPSEVSSDRKKVDTSAGYNRGEGQKPVSKAYKDNWNLIFGTKKKR
ncbi:MAG TPA: hypothetical protein VGJ20_02100 [Xanthobacteraceae bacterium]